jgi:hypothetical protein
MLAVRVLRSHLRAIAMPVWQLYEPEKFMHITTVTSIVLKALGENCEEVKGKGDSYA